MNRIELLKPLEEEKKYLKWIKKAAPIILYGIGISYAWHLTTGHKSQPYMNEIRSFFSHLLTKNPIILEAEPIESSLNHELSHEHSYYDATHALLSAIDLWEQDEPDLALLKTMTAKATTAPERDIQYTDLIQELHVTGVKLGEKPRALIDNRAYTVGEYIPTKKPLQLIKIEPRKITFCDENGCTYIKHWK